MSVGRVVADGRDTNIRVRRIGDPLILDPVHKVIGPQRAPRLKVVSHFDELLEPVRDGELAGVEVPNRQIAEGPAGGSQGPNVGGYPQDQGPAELPGHGR